MNRTLINGLIATSLAGLGFASAAPVHAASSSVTFRFTIHGTPPTNRFFAIGLEGPTADTNAATPNVGLCSNVAGDSGHLPACEAGRTYVVTGRLAPGQESAVYRLVLDGSNASAEEGGVAPVTIFSGRVRAGATVSTFFNGVRAADTASVPPITTPNTGAGGALATAVALIASGAAVATSRQWLSAS